ncbi:uncharacterized protein G2W53_040191 [Senna tora]|uniref:Uncharacterized protein n=1 Tax=Senna tora TaxID=362788 RepID=A0A834SP14_9FABA|nr:uncharacterized protein G2W53_040191 [Senna tora]
MVTTSLRKNCSGACEVIVRDYDLHGFENATSLRLPAMMMVADSGSDDDSDRNSSSSMFVKGEEEKIVKWR